MFQPRKEIYFISKDEFEITRLKSVSFKKEKTNKRESKQINFIQVRFLDKLDYTARRGVCGQDARVPTMRPGRIFPALFAGARRLIPCGRFS